MHYRRLGDSELEVSAVSYGTWLTFGRGIGAGTAERILRQAFDEGINFLDTANVYGFGRAESMLGELLQHVPRDSYLLATKLYFAVSPEDRGLSRKQIHKQIDLSLERLRTDYVDLYQCHRYDDKTPLEETMEALGEIIDAGKVRYVGFSEWPLEAIERAQKMTGVPRFVSSQPQYSMLHRGPEQGLLGLCARSGISQIVWSPLAQGLLTGKYRSDVPPPEDSRAASPDMNAFMPSAEQKPALEVVEQLRPIADEAGISLPQLALAWVLRQPNVASAIVGASRPEQIAENAKAADLRLDHDVLAAIEGVLDSEPADLV